MDKTYNQTKFFTWLFLGVIWVLGTYLFPIQETMPSLQSSLAPTFRLIGDAIIVMMGIAVMRNKFDILFLAGFVVITLISNNLNGDGIMVWANGMRHYIPFLFIIPIIRFLTATKPRAEYFITSMDKTLYAFLWVQVPCTIYQCILYGAFDNVGGSYGWMMSPVVSTTLYITSFYLIIRNWDYGISIRNNIKENWKLILLLLPSYLNETKISFIYLALFFLLLIPMYKQFVRLIIVAIPLIMAALFFVGFLYLSLVNTHGEDIFSKEYMEYYMYGDEDAQEYILEYFLQDDNIDPTQGDIARGIKFMAVPTIMDDKPHAWLFGYGIGQFKGGSMTDLTPFAKQYEWLITGTVMAGFQWILELGIIGTAWIVCYLLFVFQIFKKRAKREMRIQWYMGIVTILLIPYQNIFVILPFSMIYMYIIFMSSHWKVNTILPHGDRKVEP